MTISHTLKLIFIHVHRTGGSTLISLLKSQLGKDVEILSQHGNATTWEAILLEKNPNYFTFGFVRNPWDRMLSWYLMLNKWNPQDLETERRNFERFLELDHAAELSDNYFHYNQLDYFPKNPNELNGISIYRYENYEQEVQNLMHQFGFLKVEVPKLNGTISKDYRAFYSEKSKKWIEQNCQKDIEYFNYTF